MIQEGRIKLIVNISGYKYNMNYNSQWSLEESIKQNKNKNKKRKKEKNYMVAISCFTSQLILLFWSGIALQQYLHVNSQLHYTIPSTHFSWICIQYRSCTCQQTSASLWWRRRSRPATPSTASTAWPGSTPGSCTSSTTSSAAPRPWSGSQENPPRSLCSWPRSWDSPTNKLQRAARGTVPLQNNFPIGDFRKCIQISCILC